MISSGIWLAAAFLINRIVGIVLWDSIHGRVPVPRLLRDVTALLIYLLALTGIVGVVFDKPIGPFWAASGVGAIVLGLALTPTAHPVLLMVLFATASACGYGLLGDVSDLTFGFFGAAAAKSHVFAARLCARPRGVAVTAL